ncbi:hypothetical protein KRP22_002079 [Phytophthora ramorum]|nr:C2 domain-containing protein 3 [Phytophthora ramorum]
MSLSRRFLSLPQELEGTSLPPQVSGKRCGTVVLCVGHILESAVSSRPLPSVSLVRVRWWGEQQPSSLFRPSLLSAAPVAGEEPRTIAMKYPVRVPPDQLVAYFSDMKDLTLDVIDRGSKKKFGECKLKLDVESDNSVLTAEEKLVALRREDALCEIKPSGAGQENEVLGYLAVSFDVQWGDFKKEDFEGEFSAWSSASSVSLPSKREWTDFEVEKEDSSPLDVESELRSVAGVVKMGLKMEMDEVVESRGSRDDFQRIQRLLNKGKALKQSMERAVKEKGGQEEDAGKHIYEDRAMKQVRDALLLTSSEELSISNENRTSQIVSLGGRPQLYSPAPIVFEKHPTGTNDHNNTTARANEDLNFGVLNEVNTLSLAFESLELERSFVENQLRQLRDSSSVSSRFSPIQICVSHSDVASLLHHNSGGAPLPQVNAFSVTTSLRKRQWHLECSSTMLLTRPSSAVNNASTNEAEFSGHIHVFQSLLAEDASKYFSSGQLIIEVWLHASKETDRTLLGLSKLPLRNFATFLRREGSDLHGFSAQSLPFIGVDGRFPIDNPFNGNHAGYLRARVCIGTAEQLLTFATTIRSFVKFQAVIRGVLYRKRFGRFHRLSRDSQSTTHYFDSSAAIPVGDRSDTQSTAPTLNIAAISRGFSVDLDDGCSGLDADTGNQLECAPADLKIAAVLLEVTLCLGSELHEQEGTLLEREKGAQDLGERVFEEGGKWYKRWRSSQFPVRMSDSMANFDKLSSELAMQARMVLTPEVVTNLQEACANVMVLLWCDTCNAPHEIGSSEVPMASVLYRAQGIRGMFPIRVGTELSAARVGVHCFVDHSLLDSPRDISNDGSAATDGNSRLCDIQLKPDRGFVRPLLPLMSPTSPEEVSQNEMNFLNPFLKKACEVWIEEGRNIVVNEGEAEHYAYSNAVLRVSENHSYTRSGFLAKGIDGLDDDNLGSDEGDSDSDSLEITVDCFKPITLASFGIDELELSPLTEVDTSLDEHMHDTDIEAVDVLHRSFDGGSKVKGVECEDDGFSANDVNDEQSVHDEPLSTQASPSFARTSIEDKAVGSTMESPSVNIGVDVNKLELKEGSRTNDAALGSRVSKLKPEVVVDKDANGGQPESDTSNYSGKQTVQYADKAVQVDLLELEIPDVIPSPTQIGRSIDSKLDGDSDIGHSDAEGIDLSCEKNSTADVGCDAMESADMFCSSEDNCESESEASEVSTTIDLEMKREADHEVLEAITTGSKVGILGAPNEQTAAHSPFSSAEHTNSEQECGQGIIQRQKHADAAPSDLKSEKLELVYEMLREMRDSYFAKPLSDPVRDAGYREVSTNESKEVATKEVSDVRCRCPSPDRSKEFTPSSLKDLLSVAKGPISPQARNLPCDDGVTRVPLGDEIHKGYVDNTKKVLPKLHLVERQMQGKRTRLDDTKSATILRGSLYNAGERKQFHDTQATLVSSSDMWIAKQRKCLHSVVKKEEHSSARSLFAHDSETERIARIMQGSMNYWMKEDSSSSCDDEVSANEDTSDDDCYF